MTITRRTLFSMMGIVWLAAMGQALPASASDLEVRDVQLESQGNGRESFTVQLSEPATLRYVTLHNPPRLAIDLPVFQWRVPASSMQHYNGSLLSQVRYARNSETTSRIVLDLKQDVAVSLISTNPSDSPSFSLQGRTTETSAPTTAAPTRPTRGRSNSMMSTNPGWRQQPEVVSPPHAEPSTTISDAWSPSQRRIPQAQAETTNTPPQHDAPAPEDSVAVASPKRTGAKRVIAIDAGHGGQDPGCIGPSGVREKNITLAYAKALRDALNATGRYRAALTRSTDIFIPLRQRVAIARKAKADLFISLHADSAPGAPVRGLSLYSLSETGSDKEADKLAASENKADIIDGVDLSGASADVTDILINLAQRATMDKSAILARSVVRGMASQSIETLPTPYRTAGFAVLKAADTPSILIEIGFLSHPQEEQLLQSNRHQQQIARGIVKGIDSFFASATTRR